MKKQSFITILFVVLMSMTGTKTIAHDIEVINADGVTIYYNWINDRTELEVTYRGSYSTEYDEYIGSIVIPEFVQYEGNNYPVTSIDDSSFDKCSGLTSVTIPNSVISIGSFAFYRCSGLSSMTIPNSVVSIGTSAFEGTTWYNNQPDGLVYAGKVVYMYKGDMPANTNITIKDGTLGIAGDAFSGCSGLTSVTIPNSVISIGSYAFSGCSGLTSVIIPNSVISIESNAFSNCGNLTSVTIPSSVISLGNSAFSGCISLSSVTIQNGLTSIGDYAFSGDRTLTSVTIPNSVTTIGSGAFYECSALNSISIPNSLSSIKNDTFYGCSALPSVTIPNTVTFIGDEAFYRCSGMTSITIPNSVTSIGYAAFCGCSGLTSVIIPNSVIELRSYAFDGTTWYNNQPDGLIYIGEVAYKYKGKMPDNTQITIKDGTRVIAGSTFFNCSGLTSIIIPNSVISIGDNAFWGCTALTSVTIPNRVSSICGGTFQDCTSLSSITIPDSVSSIGSYAFWGCSSLESVSIPNSVIRIGSRAFDGTKWYDNQPDGLVYAGKVALNYKGIMPANTHISIKDGTLGIAADAFSGSTLTSISLPNSMTFIGESALYWADLQIVISQIENPFSIQGSSENPPTFSYNTFEKATLYVPEGTIEKYRATDGWKDFENIETVANFVQMELQGDVFVQIPVGTSYVDAGFKATMNGQDASSYIVTSGLDKIDVNKIGIYEVKYSTNNDINTPISVTRVVVVYDPTIKTDLSGIWITQDGTQRIYYSSNNLTPFAGYTCKIEKVLPGIFTVSDFFAGYYDQRAGYGGSYACKGYLGLLADNTLVCLDNYVNGWGDTIDEGTFVGTYDPNTEMLTWQCDYVGEMTFYIYLKSNEPRPVAVPSFKVEDQAFPVGIYTIDGRRISQPQHGLNIIRMSDGQSRKIFIK